MLRSRKALRAGSSETAPKAGATLKAQHSALNIALVVFDPPMSCCFLLFQLSTAIPVNHEVSKMVFEV